MQKGLNPENFISLFDLPDDTVGTGNLESVLSQKINELIMYDFERLIRILYRLDIDEKKLKETLAGHSGEDAGKLITSLIIEREQKKAETKNMFRQENNISDEDRW